MLRHPGGSQLSALSGTGAGLQAKPPTGLHVSTKAGTADLPEASPSPLLALRAAGRRDAMKQQKARSQHPAISCAGERKVPTPADNGRARNWLPIAFFFFFPCGFYGLLHLSHSQQEEHVCRGLTHPKQEEPSPGSADRLPPRAIERGASMGHSTPRTSCLHPPRAASSQGKRKRSHNPCRRPSCQSHSPSSIPPAVAPSTGRAPVLAEESRAARACRRLAGS